MKEKYADFFHCGGLKVYPTITFGELLVQALWLRHALKSEKKHTVTTVISKPFIPMENL